MLLLRDRVFLGKNSSTYKKDVKKLIESILGYGATPAKEGPFKVIPSMGKWKIMIGYEKDNDGNSIIRWYDGNERTKKVLHFIARNREEIIKKNYVSPIFDESYFTTYKKPYILGNVLKYTDNGLAIAEAMDESGKKIQIATDPEFLERTSDEYHICWYPYVPA